MTSNHPEKLDPALIRPGRINKRVYLGAMKATQAARMAAHHYPGACPEALAALERAVPCNLLPAQLEALCTEHEHVAELAAALIAQQHKQMSHVGADADAQVMAQVCAGSAGCKSCDTGQTTQAMHVDSLPAASCAHSSKAATAEQVPDHVDCSNVAGAQEAKATVAGHDCHVVQRHDSVTSTSTVGSAA